jgi:MerR family mercuric resistance operon transcriptional regulator
MAHTLTIGWLARATGVSARTIRYYEQVGVLPRPARTAAGYRQYTEQGVERVLFVHRARVLGLSLRQVKALGAALDGPRAGLRPRLRELVLGQLAAVGQRVDELGRLQEQLEEVLRRLQAPSRRGGKAGRCPCLDACEP